MDHMIEHHSVGDEEKRYSEGDPSKLGSPSEVEDVHARLWLSEEEAYLEAKTHPDQTREIFITFSPADKDNPRNWSRVRKWYITWFASCLNVATYERCLYSP